MRTEKQREASRINGTQSSGPSTPEGKAISSKNAFKLGICVGDGAFYEDPEARNRITKLLNEYGDFYQPRSPFERDALEEIALCTVRLARLHSVEEGLYAEGRERAFVTQSIPGPDGKPIPRYELSLYPPEERPFVATMHVAAAWRPIHDLFDSLSRQETRLSNRLRRAQQRFKELVAERKNEPEPAPKPEEKVLKNEPEPVLTPSVSEVGQGFRPAAGLPPGVLPSPAMKPACPETELPPRKGPDKEVA